MAWNELVVNGTKLLTTPLRPETKDYPDCSTDGKILQKKQATKGSYKWYLPDGTEYNGEKQKLVNGKPMPKMKRTTSIPKADKEPIADVDNYDAAELLYVRTEDKNFIEELRKAKMALTFPFTMGGGLKIYRAHLYPKGEGLIMRLSRVNVAKKVAEIEEGINAGKSLEALQREMEAAERASEAEMLKELNI